MSTVQQGNGHMEKSKRWDLNSWQTCLLHHSATGGLEQTTLGSSATHRHRFIVNSLKFSLDHAVSHRDDLHFFSLGLEGKEMERRWRDCPCVFQEVAVRVDAMLDHHFHFWGGARTPEQPLPWWPSTYTLGNHGWWWWWFPFCCMLTDASDLLKRYPVERQSE